MFEHPCCRRGCSISDLRSPLLQLDSELRLQHHIMKYQQHSSRRLMSYAVAGNRAEGTGSTAKPCGGDRAMRVAASEAALQASAASFGRAEAGTLEFPAEAFKMLIPGLGSFQGKVRPESAAGANPGARKSASGRAWSPAVTVTVMPRPDDSWIPKSGARCCFPTLASPESDSNHRGRAPESH